MKLIRKFLKFAGKSDAPALAEEIVTRATAATGVDLWGALPDPDPILEQAGEGSEALDRLIKDAHLTSVMQSRKIQTLRRFLDGCVWEPGAPDGGEPTPAAVRLRDALVEDLWRVDMYGVTAEVLDAPFYGFTPVELTWAAKSGRLRLTALTPKPQEWFGYNSKNQPVFLSLMNPMGEELPPGKFVFARHFPTYRNPYGLRLLSRCFWPVAFKHGGWGYFVQFVERFGSPWIIGKYRSGAQPAEQNDLLARLSAMVSSAVAVIPQGSSIELAEPSSKSGDGPHAALISLCNAEVSKVIMGQTLAAEVGGGHSNAAAQTHKELLNDYGTADAALVAAFWEETAFLYGQLNAPGVPSPRFRFVEAEDLQNERADRDVKLHQVGVEFTETYFQEVYGLAEGHFRLAAAGADAAAEGGQPRAQEGPTAEFAEGEGLSLEQQAIEALVAEALPQGVRDMQGVVEKILAVVEAAGTPEELEERFAREFGGLLVGGGFDQTLSRAFLAADLTGRWQVRRGR